jgi:competence protein ComEC
MTHAGARVRAAVAAAREHPRHLALAALAIGLGLGPRAPALALACGALLAAVLVERPGWALVTVLALLAGALGAQARLRAVDATSLRPLLGQRRRLRAVLLEQPRRGRFAASALAVLRDGPGAGERVVLRIGRWARMASAPTGAVLLVDGKLAPLGPYDGYQRTRGAHALVRVRQALDTGARRGGLAGAVDGVRARAERAIDRGLRPPQAALLRWMILGQDERLDDVTRQEFRTSGLSHILAASGQNVVLLAALATPLLALAGLGLRARLFVLIGLVGLYVPLAGAGPPIQRAGVMGAAGIVAALAGRPASRWYALGLAIVATLALNPRASGDPGWQLSFAAVVSILLLAPRIRDRLERARLGRPLAEGAALTLAATLGTAPLIAFHFSQVSLVAIPANLLAAAAVAPAMWLGFLSAAVGQVWLGAASALNFVNAPVLGFVGWVAHVAAGLPDARLPVQLPSPLAVAALYCLLAAVVASRRVRRIATPVALGAAVVGVALASASGGARQARAAGVRVSFLDVGQGDATLVQDGAHAMLVDAGPPDGPVLARLARASVERLDVLVVTHDQADHEGGAVAVLRRYPVGLVLDGGAGAPSIPHRALLAAAARAHVRVLAPDAGQAIRAGALELDVLWPALEPYAAHAGQDPNGRAIVGVLRAGGLRVLLPADAESDVTAPLDLSNVDVLKVAHHGSADPGLPALLRRLHPRLAVIEVGRHNSYGHPTRQALAALGVVPRVLRTDRDGTVQVRISHGRLAVFTHV